MIMCGRPSCSPTERENVGGMAFITFPLLRHSSRWWLYFLTHALLVLTAGTLAFELAQGPSRGVFRIRL